MDTPMPTAIIVVRVLRAGLLSPPGTSSVCFAPAFLAASVISSGERSSTLACRGGTSPPSRREISERLVFSSSKVGRTSGRRLIIRRHRSDSASSKPLISSLSSGRSDFRCRRTTAV